MHRMITVKTLQLHLGRNPLSLDASARVSGLLLVVLRPVSVGEW